MQSPPATPTQFEPMSISPQTLLFGSHPLSPRQSSSASSPQLPSWSSPPSIYDAANMSSPRSPLQPRSLFQTSGGATSQVLPSLLASSPTRVQTSPNRLIQGQLASPLGFPVQPTQLGAPMVPSVAPTSFLEMGSLSPVSNSLERVFPSGGTPLGTQSSVPQFTPYSDLAHPSPMSPISPQTKYTPQSTAVTSQGYNPWVNVLGYGIDTSIPGFNGNLRQLAELNISYRMVLYTGPLRQIVLMNLDPDQDIGAETHQGVEQFIQVESGQGYAVLDGRRVELTPGMAINIPSGVNHNVISIRGLKLVSIYSPPVHPYDAIDQTKVDAAVVGR